MHEKFIPRGIAKLILKKRILLTVDPACIHDYADVPFYRERLAVKKKFGTKIGNFINNQILLHRSGFCPGGDWDRDTRPVETRSAYRNMLDLWECKDHFQQSRWYKKALEDLSLFGRFQYKKITVLNKNDLDRFFCDYLLNMLISMHNDGYLPRLNAENPRVLVARDGKLVKTRKGRHRFAAARIVGVPRIRVEIDNIHPLWLRTIDGGFYGKKLRNTLGALAQLSEDNHDCHRTLPGAPQP